ncbi:hypothetical protein F5Y03DRAFT_410061 [Xylaria venustula]|nr:hypothetical protein F5Y03DRAFT_410061 [Xylaria venustula]
MGRDGSRLELPGFDKPSTRLARDGEYFMHALLIGWRFSSVGLKVREVRMMEPKAQQMNLNGDIYMSQKMFDNCIKELHDKAQEYQDTRFISILNAEIEVVQSDTAISPSLAGLLKSYNWHPGSDNKVPIRGCAKFSGNGETYSLPAEPKWNGIAPALLGCFHYINNLHPGDHIELYAVLEQLVDAAVPLWERCSYKRRKYDNVAKPRISETPLGDDEEDIFFPEDEFYEWKIQHRVLKWPEPDDYDPLRTRSAEMRPNLRSMFPDELQMTFKLANIHLSPSNPEYECGSLHVQGRLNDRIVATALYYYDCDNITESALTLYHTVISKDVYIVRRQSEFEPQGRRSIITNEDPALQRLGRAVTREGRLIAFPNVLGHQVQPFKLADETRPSHRKILAMFLVDPHVCVLSTSVVPPQRKDWWAREVRKDAVTTRKLLIHERSWVKWARPAFDKDNSYNLCEH